MERLVAQALRRSGIRYAREHEPGNVATLDFYLPDFDAYIEVKRFHSDRIAGQMKRAPNVIVLQGEAAVQLFCDILEK